MQTYNQHLTGHKKNFNDNKPQKLNFLAMSLDSKFLV